MTINRILPQAWSILATVIFIMFSTPAYALDGFTSMETDFKGGGVAVTPDWQMQVGQKLGENYRVYFNLEETKPNEGLPNSPRNYRIGLEINHLQESSGLKFEIMGCRYLSNNNSIGTRVTWSGNYPLPFLEGKK